MTRYETFKNLSVRELAELIEEHVTTELGFCKAIASLVSVMK